MTASTAASSSLDLVNVQQDQQAVVQLASTEYVLTRGNGRRRRDDLLLRHPRKNALTASTITPSVLPPHVHYHDAGFVGGLFRRQSEAESQIDHRNHGAAPG